MSALSNTLITDFTEGNITGKLYRFAFPLFLSSLLQVVYNMVDMIVVGHVMGKVGLSAVAVGGDVSNFLTFLAMGFCNAGQVIISQYIGAGKRSDLGRFISTMFSSLMICAIILSGVFIVLRVPVLNLMNTPPEAFSEALAYSTICISGSVFIYGYNITSAVMRGMGDSKNPFIFVALASVINIILDIIFVACMKMGAAGAAYATVVSQAISFILCSIFILRNREKYSMTVKFRDFLRPDLSMFISLAKLGVPMAIKSASIHFSKLFVNSWINSYGVAVSAFAGIAAKLSAVSNLISNSLNTAGSSMVGQNIGAKKFKRVPMIMKSVFFTVFGISTLMSVAILIFPEAIFSVFTTDGAVMEVAMEYIPIAVLMFYGSAARAPMNAFLNGSGNYRINFVTAILDGIVMRIGLSVFFGLTMKLGYSGFWLGDALAGFTPLWIGIVFYLKGSWRKNALTK